MIRNCALPEAGTKNAVTVVTVGREGAFRGEGLEDTIVNGDGGGEMGIVKGMEGECGG